MQSKVHYIKHMCYLYKCSVYRTTKIRLLFLEQNPRKIMFILFKVIVYTLDILMIYSYNCLIFHETLIDCSTL